MNSVGKRVISIVFINLLFMTLLFAELKVGESFPSLTLVNPYNQTVTVSKKGELTLLLSFEKDISTGIQKFLEEQERDFLIEHHMLYVSDISSLPKFLVNFFVLPKLKVFEFQVALLYDENKLNREEKKITIIHLKDNVIMDIDFIEINALESFMAKSASS